MLYRGISHIRRKNSPGPYGRTMPRALWQSWGGGLFLMSEVTLYITWPDRRPGRTRCVVSAMLDIVVQTYRGTLLIRNSPPLGHYSRTKPRTLWWS